eukprot:TRINITY_DN1006_c0_g1_i4.p1 TRINITY_DN1006_c0_g1~~TRINITY_DN1006_c0_g1_i4.p1  ORF type:complete len:270 (-),score=30.20 TRINITY_DN1006_c0_g1_i4:172-981(-)
MKIVHFSLVFLVVLNSKQVQGLGFAWFLDFFVCFGGFLCDRKEPASSSAPEPQETTNITNQTDSNNITFTVLPMESQSPKVQDPVLLDIYPFEETQNPVVPHSQISIRPLQREDCQATVSVLNETRDLQVLSNLVKELSLEEEISSLKDVTLFAPNNDAMYAFVDEQNIDVGDLFLFKSNVAALRQVISLHLVKEALNTDDLLASEGKSLETRLEGQSILINVKDSQVTIISPAEGSKEATVLNVNNPIKVCEGFLYIINAVLVPKYLS